MADEDGDKTEDATPRRRQEAREEGNIPKSQDLSAAVLLVGILVTLWGTGPYFVRQLGESTRRIFSPGSMSQVRVETLGQEMIEALLPVAGAVAPILLAVVVLGVLSNVAQVGFLITTKKLTPNPGVLNPIKGFSKIFFEAKTWVGFLMNLGKLLLAGAVAWFAVEAELPRIASLQKLEVLPAMAGGAWIVFVIGLKIAIVLLVLAVIDYAYQRYHHEQQLRMTKQQVKEEMKRMEGDPLIKQRRRQLAIQRSMNKIKKEVPTADVVVTNPTHFAVALKYDESTMHAPRVVAKGADHLALKIREIAGASGVPIVERPPLARAMYKTVEVGQEIPEDLYAAVAELLAYVYELERAAALGQRI